MARTETTFPIWQHGGRKAMFEGGGPDKYILTPDRLYRIHHDKPDDLDLLKTKYWRELSYDDGVRLLDNTPHRSFWIEADRIGFYLISLDSRTRHFYLTYKASVKHPYPIGIMCVLSDIQSEVAYHADPNFKIYTIGDRYVGFKMFQDGLVNKFPNPKDAIRVVMSFMCLIGAFMREIETSPDTKIYQRSPLSEKDVYSEYRGDVTLVKRVWQSSGEYNRAGPEERSQILIRRRDHAVKGHWRNLSQGRRIWIEPHRRGDAALGTVKTNIEIM